MLFLIKKNTASFQAYRMYHTKFEYRFNLNAIEQSIKLDTMPYLRVKAFFKNNAGINKYLHHFTYLV